MDKGEGLTGPEEALIRLEQRVALIERLVNGSKPNYEDDNSLVDPLLEVITKLRAITAGREDYFKLYDTYGDFIYKLDQLEGNIEPDSVKWENILAQEDKLREKSSMLEAVVSKRAIIDSTAFKNIEPLKPRMEKLKDLVIKQSEEVDKVSQETQDLIRNYNQLITRIRNKMIGWDKSLSVMELAKRK
ncbi:uncharacterized protein LOC128392458 [Panonychus citri]|uniref:uncharacterized protein LOC128392458 n=1 Tax=Panonychus citri TaxID=50023 RepID=UPI0023075FBB|nr:uncharacterized protein LOC128392458 [Panonychus citri]